MKSFNNWTSVHFNNPDSQVHTGRAIMQLSVCVYLSKGPCNEYQGSHERINVHYFVHALELKRMHYMYL